MNNQNMLYWILIVVISLSVIYQVKSTHLILMKTINGGVTSRAELLIRLFVFISIVVFGGVGMTLGADYLVRDFL